MRMHVARFQDVDDGDGSDYRGRMSMRFAQSMSQIMQSCGVSGLRMERHPAVSGSSSRLADLAMFQNVPPQVAAYARGVMEPLSEAMSAFGISELRLMKDDGDDDALKSIWGQLCEPSSSPDDDPDNLPEDGEVQL